MPKEGKIWRVRDKRRLLLAMMESCCGDAHISFEGNLKATHLSGIPGASVEETQALKRNTTWPKLDFVVVPLELSTRERILPAIGGTIPNTIIHIQIEKGGSLRFAAYDNFHPECIVFHPSMDKTILESLISEKILVPG